VGCSGIPCLYYEGEHSNKLVVYFHGNGEDITGCSNFVRNLCLHLKMSVLAVEYPGYSVYEGVASSSQIEKDAVEVVSFLQRMGFEMANIMVMGRSIGSGPAVHVASLFNVGGLVLLSPFLSLCEVVSDLYGRMASKVLKQRFDNK
jgi:abhydrolase domain-containing protein 17